MSFAPVNVKCPLCNGTGQIHEEEVIDILADAAIIQSDHRPHHHFLNIKCPLCSGFGVVNETAARTYREERWALKVWHLVRHFFER